MKSCSLVAALLAVMIPTACAEDGTGLRVEISFPKEAHTEDITGRAYVIVSTASEFLVLNS